MGVPNLSEYGGFPDIVSKLWVQPSVQKANSLRAKLTGER